MGENNDINREYILGLAVDNVSYQKALEIIKIFVIDGQKHLVVTPYAESVVAAQKDNQFREIINQSHLSVPDGGGLLAAAEFLSYSLPKNKFLRFIVAVFYGLIVGLRLSIRRSSFGKLKERVSGTDLVYSLCDLSSQKGYKVYLLGGLGDVAKESSRVLKEKFPNLTIGFSAGPAEVKKVSEKENLDLIAEVNRFGPDFLFTAFKPVEQEKWLFYHMKEINAKVFMPVGGAFDMISGQKGRAPNIFRRFNLEWFWRLLIEPSRIGRIVNAVIVFPWLVFKSRLGNEHVQSV